MDLEMSGLFCSPSTGHGIDHAATHGVGGRRPGKQTSGVLRQLPAWFKDPRGEAAPASLWSIPAATINAASLEPHREAAAATVPDIVHPDIEDGRPQAQEPSLAASRPDVTMFEAGCPACSTMAALLIQRKLNEMQGTEELARKVASTQRKVQEVESQVHLLQQQHAAAAPPCTRFIAEVADRQGLHLQKVNELLIQVDVLARSLQQLGEPFLYQ